MTNKVHIDASGDVVINAVKRKPKDMEIQVTFTLLDLYPDGFKIVIEPLGEVLPHPTAADDA